MYGLIINYSNQVWFVSKSDARIGVDKLRISPKKIKVVYGAGIQISPKQSIIDNGNNNINASSNKRRRGCGSSEYGSQKVYLR